jgi:hypothetical protein
MSGGGIRARGENATPLESLSAAATGSKTVRGKGILSVIGILRQQRAGYGSDTRRREERSLASSPSKLRYNDALPEAKARWKSVQGECSYWQEVLRPALGRRQSRRAGKQRRSSAQVFSPDSLKMFPAPRSAADARDLLAQSMVEARAGQLDPRIANCICSSKVAVKSAKHDSNRCHRQEQQVRDQIRLPMTTHSRE